MMLEAHTAVEAFKPTKGTDADPDDTTVEGSDDTIGRHAMRSFDSHVENGVNFFIFPFLLLVFNMAVYGIAMDTGYERGDGTDQALDRFKTNSNLAAFCFLVDAVVFYKAVFRVKEEIAALEKHGEGGAEEAAQEAPSTEDAPLSCSLPKYPYAKMSKKLDAFFLGNSNATATTRVSILVGLLYALMLSCAAASAACVGARIYAATPAAQQDCSSGVSSSDRGFLRDLQREAPEKDDIKIEGIPEGLQSWAVGLVIRGETEYPPNYVHMSDGRTFFVGRDKGGLTDEVTRRVTDVSSQGIVKSISGRQRNVKEILMSTQADGSILKHNDVETPAGFTILQGSEDDREVDTFCCFYSGSSAMWMDGDEATFERLDKFGFRKTRPILCVSTSFNDKHTFRNISGSEDAKPASTDFWSRTKEVLKAFEGELWYALAWEHSAGPNERNRKRRHERGSEHILEYYKIDPMSMEKTLVANFTTGFANRYHNNHRVMSEFGSDSSLLSPCINWVSTITTLVAALVALPGAFWLWRTKGVSAGVAPPTLVGCYMLHAIDWDVLYRFIVVLTFVSAWFLFGNQRRQWLDREALIWAHYSLFAYVAVVDWYEESMDLITWGILIGALLNHRTLEIGGLGFGMFFVCMALSDQGAPEVAWILICAGVFLGSGMFSIGRYFNKRHSYFLFCVKRFSQRLRANAQTSGGENDLTQRLVD